MPDPLLGAVEGGGTKFLCAVGRGPDDVAQQVRIATSDPASTLKQVVEFLAPHPLRAVGVGMFGPLELRKSAGARFGSTLATPKPGWTDIPVHATLANALHVPVSIDTDVNAAALAEASWGAARGADPVVYMTVGTGIGVGVLVHGQPLHGLMHPELGHMPVPQLSYADGSPDTFAGVCKFHGRCLEGMAAGSALRQRLQRDPATVGANDPVWSLEAAYLAHGIVAAILALSPERIVVGGGVLQQPQLLPKIRAHVVEILGGYVPRPELGPDIERFIVPAAIVERAGLAGAFALAARM